MLKNNGTSFYYQIADTIHSRIKSGQYPADMVLPSSYKLCKEFGVSDITIRNAMDILVREGVIVRKRGVGTIVTNTNNIKIVRRMQSLKVLDWFNVPGPREKQSLEVLEIREIDCPKPIQNIFKLSASDTIIKMNRIRKFNSEPISYFINYFSPSLFKKSVFRKFNKMRFLKILFLETNIQTINVDHEIEVFVADVDLANNLQIKFGDPLFLVSTTYRRVDSTVLAFTQGYHRGDRSVLTETSAIDRHSVIVDSLK
jgi:GntR family transcriptional regulator